MAKKKSKTMSDDLIKKQNQPAQTDKAQPEKKKSKTMSDDLIEKYKAYANSEEAYAVLFVKKHLNAAQGKWIDIISTGFKCDMSRLEFEFVECELFKRILKPKYPSKKDFIRDGKFDEYEYTMACRAVTWHTAHDDIFQQRLKRVKGLLFRLHGRFVEVPNPNYKEGFFVEDAPDEIKALADNLNDRTDPLWDKALQYINKVPPTLTKFKFQRVEYVKR